MKRTNGLLIAFLGGAFALSWSGCSSTSTADVADAGDDDAGSDTSTRDPNANCVKPGTPNNEVGIGGYCEPGSSACITDAGIHFCTGAFDAPANAWFCTKVCMADSECGTGAYCDHSDSRGSGCTPNVCGNPPAATDSGTDSAQATDANDSGDAQGE